MSSSKQATSEDLCPSCGQPRSPSACRVVPMGSWCVQSGLKEDVARTRLPQPSGDAARIEQNPEVRAAAAVLAAAVERERQATARFEAAALAHWHGRGRRSAGTQTISVDGSLVDIRPPGTSDADIARLREAEETADGVRREAGEETVQARRLLEDIRSRVRRHLARTR